MTGPRSAWGEKANPEHSGDRGDLYIVIHVQAHRFFRRRGDDILLDLSINVAQAALGTRVQIPTVDGEEELAIAAGTQSGTILRLRGQGVPRLRRNGRGDQLVLVEVEVPKKLSPDQQRRLDKRGHLNTI